MFSIAVIEKDAAPIESSSAGSLTVFRFVQLLNANASISVTASGMVISVISLQPENAETPMYVRLSGSVTDVM